MNILPSIYRKDARGDIQIARRGKCKANITATQQGIEISLRSRRVEKSAIMTTLFFLIAGGGLALLIRRVGFTVSVYCLVVLIFLLFGKENIRIETDEMKHGTSFFGLWKPKTYVIRAISNLRVAPQSNHLLFDYGSKSVTCCEGIDGEEASLLVNNLSDIFTFQCHSVKRIIFGSHHNTCENPAETLLNPDVSSLTVPFVQLKQILVYADTYDFYQVEQFLTYAVNSIGQQYLKDNVDIHIYGNSERFHPNILNNFTNLFKRVYVHNKDELLVSMRAEEWE